MTKFLRLCSVILILGAIAALSGRVHARVGGGGSSAESWCVGPASYEVCVDAGNFFPTTDNTQTLGTSALAWATGYFYDIAASDDVTVADDLTVTGDVFNVIAATITVTAGLAIDISGYCGKAVLLQTDGASRTSDTTTTFVGGVPGCIYYLYHTGANGGGTITLDDNANFDVPANVVLGTGDGAIIADVAGATRFALLGTSDN